MPTATATLGWTITNWGPLTTSWSLPTACAEQVFIYSKEDPYMGLYAECDNGLYTCYPPPTDSNAPSELAAAVRTISLGYQAPPVYSPAPECPEGWKTVGAVAREGEGTEISRSGWFTVPYETRSDRPRIGLQDVFASLLDLSETAVMCCPSSMIAPDMGGCRSPLPDYAISTACLTHASVEYVSDFITSISAGHISWTTEKTTPPPSWTSSHAAEATVSPLFLFHKPTDLAGGEGDDDDDDEEEGVGAEENDETADPSETNAAAALRGGLGVLGVEGRVLASALGSMMVGAAMVLM
ncbi:hypothetical protein BJY01DRAFT_264289 [Aspergillus pseudoustus]|uniref:Uncharacterized protein n=1 Tax=Aspergillus pseudoustus TaxID=1810923 RepID=A0ABR4JWM1_9EURO